MDSFITMILLGLLALGHATPLILEEHHLTSLTTQAPSEETITMNIVVDDSATSADNVKVDSEEPVAPEPMDEEGVATEEDQDSSAGRVQRHSDISSEDNSTTHFPYNMSEEGSGESDEDTTTTTVATTTTTMVPFMTEDGSGVEETTTTTEMTSTASTTPATDMTTAASTVSTTEFLYMTGEGSGQSGEETPTTTHATNTTTVMIMNGEGSGAFDEETTTAAPTTTEETTSAVLPPSQDEETTTASVTANSTDIVEIDDAEEITAAMTPAEETTTTIEAPIQDDVVQKRRGMVPLRTQNKQKEESTEMIDPQPLENPTEMPKGHVTPDWVIILGFLVGVAVLVLLCVAIATRDKWNRPNQFNNTIDSSPVDPQKATELETFLYNEQPPKENGKAEEYTVIPLDELPNNYSS